MFVFRLSCVSFPLFIDNKEQMVTHACVLSCLSLVVLIMLSPVVLGMGWHDLGLGMGQHELSGKGGGHHPLDQHA